jgi:hypothetical protein
MDMNLPSMSFPALRPVRNLDGGASQGLAFVAHGAAQQSIFLDPHPADLTVLVRLFVVARSLRISVHTVLNAILDLAWSIPPSNFVW